MKAKKSQTNQENNNDIHFLYILSQLHGFHTGRIKIFIGWEVILTILSRLTHFTHHTLFSVQPFTREVVKKDLPACYHPLPNIV